MDGTGRLKWDLVAKMGLADFGVIGRLYCLQAEMGLTSCLQVTLQPASISQFVMVLHGRL